MIYSPNRSDAFYLRGKSALLIEPNNFQVFSHFDDEPFG